MKRVLFSTVLALAAFPSLATAHGGNNDASFAHACIGNLSKIARIVGPTGSCLTAPYAVAETPMHWPLSITELLAQVTALEQLVATLQTQIAGEAAARMAADTQEAAERSAADATLLDQISSNATPQNLLDLANYVSVDLGEINGLSGPHVIFANANVHIRNGLNATNGNVGSPAAVDPSETQTNGLGNLVVGYNETFFTNLPRTGSHNLVLGVGQGYPAFGGFVAGSRNDIAGAYTSVSGGQGNTASGRSASVSGGANHLASGSFSSVSGGNANTSSGTAASVAGGVGNTASGSQASVSGGRTNTASGVSATVSAGENNTASNFDAAVSGGRNNTASGMRATVSGGRDNIADGNQATVGGGVAQTASATDQNIP